MLLASALNCSLAAIGAGVPFEANGGMLRRYRSKGRGEFDEVRHAFSRLDTAELDQLCSKLVATPLADRDMEMARIHTFPRAPRTNRPRHRQSAVFFPGGSPEFDLAILAKPHLEIS